MAFNKITMNLTDLYMFGVQMTHLIVRELAI